MKYIVERSRRFCGYLTGFVFFISGILKLLDPVGAGLVMDEYFDFLHLGFPGAAAKPAAVFFALAETFIGSALITGIWRKAIAATAMGFQGFFTLLTLALVIFNPQMDCGCFGEALHLTHMQTFLKNLVLCTLLGLAFIPFRGFGRPKPRKYVSFGTVTVTVLLFTAYSLIYIPLVDFTDYRAGAVLASAADGSEDMYEAYFIYEKDGAKERFTLEDLPDSTWTFVSTETILKEGVTPPVTLSFTDAGGEYRDELAARGRVIVISIYDPGISDSKWEEIAKFDYNDSEAGFRPLILIASTPEEMEGKIPAEIAGHVYYSDFKTLVTLNRSNVGGTYFNDGQLIGKCAYAAMPDKEKLYELAHESSLEALTDKEVKGSLGFQGFLLCVFAVMLLL